MAGKTDSRRDRILAAIVRVVGRKGYKATSVTDVIKEAETTRASFYRRFENKHECFLIAYDASLERLFAVVAEGCDGSEPWVERVRRGLANLVETFAREPELARTMIVEVVGAGADGRRRHWEALTRLGECLDSGRESTLGLELPEHTSRMAIGAVSGLIFDELAANRPTQLPALMPDLLFSLLVPYLGPKAAAEAIRRVG
jgi:AcrR family transcriptional regulator